MHTVQCNEYLFIYFSNHPARTNRFSQLRSVRCCTASIDRSIELQATGVGPFHPSFRHSPTLPTSRPSTLYSFLCFLPSVTLYITYNIYIYIYLTLSFQWRGPRYPNSISVQLQFIPVSKRRFTLRSSLPPRTNNFFSFRGRG